MLTVERPVAEPAPLTHLKQEGGENFGILNVVLDQVFHGVCAYCERQPLWRAPGAGLGSHDTDLSDEDGLPFTCDHLRPRRLLCSNEAHVGRCTDHTPPHDAGCSIYDWDNLIYACQPCNSVKGGQWAGEIAAASSYIDPCADPLAGNGPDAAFEYDLGSGEIKPRDGVAGSIRANAEQTIQDLALNYYRGHEESTRLNADIRRVDLAALRHQWILALTQSLERLAMITPDLIPAVIASVVAPHARFSTICRQFIEQSEYRRYLV